MNQVEVGDVRFANHLPFSLICGLNVLESSELALSVADDVVGTARALGIDVVFKGSFDKANRSSIHSYRGPGLDTGLGILREVSQTHGVPVVTDVHEPGQVEAVAEVCQLLQLPAFLARQTDLVEALAASGRPVNIKKPQFLSPEQMRNVVDKFVECGNSQLLLCERGSCFGYDNLVVDMLGFGVMRRVCDDRPLVFDATHALQLRAPGASASGGRRHQLAELARAGLAVGLAGLFIEVHPDPDAALCDGPSALPLAQLRPFLEQMQAVDAAVKALPPLTIQ